MSVMPLAPQDDNTGNPPRRDEMSRRLLAFIQSQETPPTKAEILDFAVSHQGVGQSTAEAALEKLLHEGHVYQPRPTQVAALDATYTEEDASETDSTETTDTPPASTTTAASPASSQPVASDTHDLIEASQSEAYQNAGVGKRRVTYQTMTDKDTCGFCRTEDTTVVHRHYEYARFMDGERIGDPIEQGYSDACPNCAPTQSASSPDLDAEEAERIFQC